MFNPCTITGEKNILDSLGYGNQDNQANSKLIDAKN